MVDDKEILARNDQWVTDQVTINRDESWMDDKDVLNIKFDEWKKK